MRPLWCEVRGMKDILILILMALGAGLSIYCLWLDNRVHQLEGYIARLERYVKSEVNDE